jgi:FKBP-type peptidyl-prolyl cis-trans isomerase FkpA
MWINKYVVIGISLLVITGFGVTGYLLWHQNNQKPTVNFAQTSLNGNGSTSGQGNAPLAPSSNNSGGLSVSSSTPTDGLGQVAGSQSSSNNQTSGSGSSSSSQSPVDPSTFSQYDKYKSNNGALFGDIQVGNGAALTSGQTASVTYKGWLTNGQLFDESKTDSSGNLLPFTFTLGAHQVIAGWEEGLSGMKVGGTRLLIVPPSVGYGATGQGSIPPNAVLVFEVQLLSAK